MIKSINNIEIYEVNGMDPDPARTDPPLITLESHPLNEDWSVIRIGAAVSGGNGVHIAIKTDDLIRAAQNSANRGTTNWQDHMKKYGLTTPG
jgi:hypothetical protein